MHIFLKTTIMPTKLRFKFKPWSEEYPGLEEEDNGVDGDDEKMANEEEEDDDEDQGSPITLYNNQVRLLKH